MAVKILFFGATADVTGERELVIENSSSSRAAEIFNQILKRYPQLSSYRLLFSINQQYATGRETVRDGDELAVFTAVSGG